MHLVKTLLVSAVVLTSSSTLAEAVLAEDKLDATPYKCHVPLFGSNRCGDPDRNLRLGPYKRLTIVLSSIPGTPADPECVIFTVHHAVQDKTLATTKTMCNPGAREFAWTNPDETSVDVFMTVKSVGASSFDISGSYLIDRP